MKKMKFLTLFTSSLLIVSSILFFRTLTSKIDAATSPTAEEQKSSLFEKMSSLYPSFLTTLNLKRFFTEHPALWFSDNFYEVEKGKLYRSKTLSAESLEHYILTHGIKSILILRDLKPGEEEWLPQEIEIAKKHNVTVHWIPLKMNLPKNEEIKKITKVFDNAEQPLLVHCKAGADRTGMIAALWVLYKMNGSLQEALAQLRQKYAHVELFKPSMKQFINIWYYLQRTTQDPLSHYNHEQYPHFQTIEDRLDSYLMSFKNSLPKIF